MRTKIMRGGMTGFRDMKLRHLPVAALGFVATLVMAMVLLLPFSWLSRADYGEDAGVTTTIGTVAETASVAAFTYTLGVVAVLLGLCWTLGSARYIVGDVPRLIWRNRERFLRGFLRAVAVPMIVVCAYWVMIQRIPMRLDPLGLWIVLSMVAVRFTLTDSYRAFRDDMTLLDSFGTLMPKKMRRDRTETKGGRTRRMLSRVPMFTWGDGALAFPLLQALGVTFFGVLGSAVLFANRPDGTEEQTWMYGYLVCIVLALFIWSFLFRIVDAVKPWGEKGKLSIVRHRSKEETPGE